MGDVLGCNEYPIKVVMCPSEDACIRQVIATLRASNGKWLLVPSWDAVNAWQENLAVSAPDLAFGLHVATIEDWASGRWDLFGDGRKIIDPIRRHLIMSRALRRVNARFAQSGVDEATIIGTGAPKVLCEAMALGSGVPSFEERLTKDPDDVDMRVRTAWIALSEYRDEMEQRGYVELGQVIAQMRSDSQAIETSGPMLAIGFDDAAPVELEFLRKSCSALIVEVGNSPAFDSEREFASIVLGANPDSNDGCLDEAAVKWADSLDISKMIGEQRSQELLDLTDHLFCVGSPLEPKGDVRFALASGSYAAPTAVATEIEKMIEHGADPGQIYVICKDAGNMFEKVAPKLSRLGIESEGPLAQALAQTELGKALCQMLVMVAICDEDFGVRPGIRFVDVLCGFALSRCSGVSEETAHKLGKIWRGDPHMQIPQAHLHITDFVKSDSAADAENDLEKGAWQILELIELARSRNIAEAAKKMAANAWSRLDERERLLQKRAIGRVYAIAEACDEFEADIAEIDMLLAALSVQASAHMGPQGDVDAASPEEHGRGAVSFITLEQARYTEMPYSIFAEMTSDSYPITKDDSAAIRLIAAPDLDASNRLLPTIRLAFYEAVRNVSKQAVFERELTTFDADLVRPSVLLEEICDCYNPDISNPGSVDEDSGLPVSLLDDGVRENVVSRYDEGQLMQLLPVPAYACDADLMPKGDSVTRVPAGVFQTHDAQELMQQPYQGQIAFSPSSVELYTMCPYGWFIQRRVNPRALDADPFSPAAQGTVVHATMEGFYKAWRLEDTPARLDREDLDKARPIFDAAFAQALAAQETDEMNPLLPTTKMQEHELQTLKNNAWKLLQDDVDYLTKAFAPSEFEFKFGYPDDDCEFKDVEYAGRPFRGSVDRIDMADIDGHKYVAITDYKGNIDKQGYSPTFKALEHNSDAELVLPPRIQIFIYAGIVQKLLRDKYGPDVEVTGAFYRSYRPGKPICGAHSTLLDRTGDAMEIYGANGFQDMLSKTEKLVSVALDAMESGYFAAAPRTNKACEYCPVKDSCQFCLGDNEEASARWI